MIGTLQISISYDETFSEMGSPSPFTQAKKSEITLFNKHVGSTLWWDHLADEGPNCDVQGFLSSWDKQVKIFRDRTQKYYL